MFLEAFAQPAEVEGLHILKRGIAGVVHDYIHDHSNAAGVGLFNQGAEFLASSKVCVRAGKVQGVVTVIAIVLEIPPVATANPAVNLLEGWSDPDSVDAQLVEVIQLFGQARKVAAVEGADFVHAIGFAAIVPIIIGATVGESVGHGKVNSRTGPVEALFRGVGGLNQ